MAENCRCPACIRFSATYEAEVQWHQQNTASPVFGHNRLSSYALQYAQELQHEIDLQNGLNGPNGQNEPSDGPQHDLAQSMQQQQQQQQHMQPQPPLQQAPVNLMALGQHLYAENALVAGSAHAAENVQAGENAQQLGIPCNMSLQLPYHQQQQHAPAAGQLLPGHHATTGLDSAAPPPLPPSRATPASLAPITAQAAEELRRAGRWSAPDGPPPGPPSTDGQPLPRGTFIRAVNAPTANHRRHDRAICDRCIRQHDVCRAHYKWPCSVCAKQGGLCNTSMRPTNFVAVRIDPQGYDLGHGFVVREVSGRLEAPPRAMLAHIQEQQKHNPEY